MNVVKRTDLWTQEEDLLLTRLYAVRTPLADIALRVGRTFDAVVKRRKRLGLVPHKSEQGRPSTTQRAAERNRVMGLIGRGLSHVEVSEITGIPPHRISRIVSGAGEADGTMNHNDDDFVRRLMADGGMPRYPTHPLNGSIIGAAWCGPDGGHWKGATAMRRAA